jgi:hypothetical protein
MIQLSIEIAGPNIINVGGHDLLTTKEKSHKITDVLFYTKTTDICEKKYAINLRP